MLSKTLHSSHKILVTDLCFLQYDITIIHIYNVVFIIIYSYSYLGPSPAASLVRVVVRRSFAFARSSPSRGFGAPSGLLCYTQLLLYK